MAWKVIEIHGFNGGALAVCVAGKGPLTEIAAIAPLLRFNWVL